MEPVTDAANNEKKINQRHQPYKRSFSRGRLYGLPEEVAHQHPDTHIDDSYDNICHPVAFAAIEDKYAVLQEAQKQTD